MNKLQYLFKKRLCLLFPLIAIVAYWQLALLQQTMIWDAIDVVLPLRIHAGSMLQQNELPLWNPYILFGYPMYTDLQCSGWNLENLVIGYFFGYSNYSIHFLFIAYVSLAGYGMYKLCTLFNRSESLNLILGVTYMLSGMIASHAQLLPITAGIAILPFITWYFLLLLFSPSIFNSAKFIITLFCFTTIAYQAFVVIYFYIFIIITIAYFVFLIRRKQFQAIKTKVPILSITVLIAIVSQLILFYTIHKAGEYSSRFHGLPMEQILFDPFTPDNLLSFLYPVKSLKNLSAITDVTMSNGYIGLVSLFLFFTSIVKLPKRKISYLFLCFILLCLITSFGESFYLRKLFAQYLPFMDSFRFPALFRIPTVFFLLLVVAIENPFESNSFLKLKQYLIYFFLGLSILAIIIGSIYFFQQNGTWYFKSATLSYYEKFRNASFEELLFIYSIWLILLCSLALIFIKRSKDFFSLKKVLVVITILDLCIGIQSVIQVTVVGETKPKEIASTINKVPYLNPSPTKASLYAALELNNNFKYFWKNTGIFKKTLSFDEWFSYQFDSYSYIDTGYTNIKKYFINRSFIYAADTILAENYWKKINPDVDPNNYFFLKHTDSLKMLIKKVFLPQYKLLKSSSTNYEISTSSQSDFILNIQQSYFDGWKVWIDGKESKILKNAGFCLATMVSAGEHKVIFQFEDNTFIGLLVLSYAIIIICFVYIFVYKIKTMQNKKAYLLFIGLGFASLFTYRFFMNAHYRQNKEMTVIENASMKAVDTIPQNQFTSFIHQDTLLIKNSGNRNPLVIHRLDEYTGWQALSKLLEHKSTDYFLLKWFNHNIKKEAIAAIQEKYPQVVAECVYPTNGFMLFKVLVVKQKDYYTDFEKPNMYFTGDTSAYVKISNNEKTNRVSYVDSLSPYSSTFKYTIKADDSISKIFTHLKFNCPLRAQSLVCISITRAGKQIHFSGQALAPFKADFTRTWATAYYSPEELPKLLANDEIGVFVMNIGKAKILVDDFYVKFD